MRSLEDRIVTKTDDNIDELRKKHPEGLHFAVGDIHGEVRTLKKLMKKIRFDPARDHVYFVGDYDSGGDVTALLNYMSRYYQADHELPGFHMIRGNHERELFPVYPLENLPDIMVVRGRKLNFYIAHAGIVSAAFDLINDDMSREPHRKVFAYRLEDSTCCYNAPLRQVVWSLRGLYSQRSWRHVWPSEEDLTAHNACIIHGHSPYCYFKKPDRFTYGDDNLFWRSQHVWFCSELRSFNIDANVKGREQNGETYRGIACLCMEVYDELADKHDGCLSTDLVHDAENGIFGAEYEHCGWNYSTSSPDSILNAVCDMKTIVLEGDVLKIR